MINIDKLKEYCEIYKGTRNYHNYTRQTRETEARAKRYMKGVTIINESIIKNDIEFIQFEIHGSSFMYHQIRKMMGFLVTLMREWKYHISTADDGNDNNSNDNNNNETKSNNMEDIDLKSLIDYSFSDQHKISIPLMPGEGLYLYCVTFEGYNDKCGKLNLSHNEIHFDKYKHKINNFIDTNIIPNIIKHEINNKNIFGYWLYDIEHDFIFECIKINKKLTNDLNKKGIKFIPIGNMKYFKPKPNQKFLKQQNDINKK